MPGKGTVQAGWRLQSASIGALQEAVDGALAEAIRNDVSARIWAHDHTLWKPDPKEISNRLGWLHVAEAMSETSQRLRAFADEVRRAGYRRALLLGMGGSSLAPEVFLKTFGVAHGCIDLAVLDSTDPGAVLGHARSMKPQESLFIVSSKSGGTVEPLSFFKFFYSWVADGVGAERAGEHFVAITDPGSGLAALADRCHFRASFLNDPNIGGRYSALSYFGLVPAALGGVDIGQLLASGIAMAHNCRAAVPAPENPGIWLGAVLGEAAKSGRDKATFVVSRQIDSFGDWTEQLLAESTGKEGKGVVPVVGEALGPPEVYGEDRLFIQLSLDGDDTGNAEVDALAAAGQPVVRMSIGDRYHLGGQFFLWELATAAAGYRLRINPFDQPNVESAKERARQMVKSYSQTGALPEERPTLSWDGIEGYGMVIGADPPEAIRNFLRGAQPGAYVSLQAYLQPTAETDEALAALRTRIRDESRLAVTVGYGPRFLHSTGQLHKGDAGRGLSIQLTADDTEDAPIPDEAGSPGSSLTFGVLKAAQAMGDRQALVDAGRKVIRFNFRGHVAGGMIRLAGR
jgi:glucose-6-phosphate isomerase